MAKKTSKVNKTNNKVQKQENSKNKKSFFKDFKAELKKVVWPTPKQLVNNTVAVITIVLITAAIVFVLDLAFKTLDEKGIDKIREVITTNETTENSTTNETTDNTTTDENATAEDTTTSEETSNEENTSTENERRTSRFTDT